MPLKLTKEQQVIIDRMAAGNMDICKEDGPKIVMRLNTLEYSRDGIAILASRAVLRDGRDGSNPRLDWKIEMYRIQKDGSVQRL